LTAQQQPTEAPTTHSPPPTTTALKLSLSQRRKVKQLHWEKVAAAGANTIWSAEEQGHATAGGVLITSMDTRELTDLFALIDPGPAADRLGATAARLANRIQTVLARMSQVFNATLAGNSELKRLLCPVRITLHTCVSCSNVFL
jgi:hypothetical protein